MGFDSDGLAAGITPHPLNTNRATAGSDIPQQLSRQRSQGGQRHGADFAFRQLPVMMNLEQKLSQLARWVTDAHARGVSFGLRLPGATIPMAGGDAQRERCLEALALFEPQGMDRNGPRPQPA